MTPQQKFLSDFVKRRRWTESLPTISKTEYKAKGRVDYNVRWNGVYKTNNENQNICMHMHVEKGKRPYLGSIFIEPRTTDTRLELKELEGSGYLLTNLLLDVPIFTQAYADAMGFGSEQDAVNFLLPSALKME